MTKTDAAPDAFAGQEDVTGADSSAREDLATN